MPRSDWLRATQRSWETFWGSDLAKLVLPADLPALERLHELYDDRARARRAYKKAPFMRGSKGQQVRNPIALDIAAFNSEIRQLEDRFGLTPRARLRLGIVFGQARHSLGDLHAALDAE